MKFALIALLVACFAVSALATCKWTSPSGVEYDFTATKDSEVLAQANNLTYSFSFCGGTPSNQECAAKNPKGASGCIYEPAKFFIVTSRWDNAEVGPVAIVEKPEGGLTLTFQNGDDFPAGGQSRLIVDLDCGKDKNSSFIDSKTPLIKLSIQSPLGCAAGSSGLSGGAIFLIIFFSVLAGYFVIGFLVCKFVLKKDGVVNSIPQNAFWCALPGLYIAGIKFAIGKCTKKNTNSEYSSSDSGYGSTEDV